MNSFAGLRSRFDSGGIKLKLELPDTFSWSDGVIPARVTFTGNKAEPRKVQELLFVVSDDEKASGSSEQSPTTVRVEWLYPGGIELAPGQVIELDVSIELQAPPTREELGEQAFGRPASGFLEKAFVAAAAGRSPENFNRYRVSVEAEVEGFAKPKRTSKHLRQGRGITISMGGASMNF